MIRKKNSTYDTIARVVIVVAFLIGLGYKNNVGPATVTINDLVIKVDVADDSAERTKGLSGVKALENNRGMLFVNESPGYYSFWMKDMKIDLDIIWIDQNQTVVYIEEYLSPRSFPESYVSDVPAIYILEVNGGTVERSGLDLGDTVEIKGL